MRHIFVVYNPLTLCKALKYIDEIYGKENSYIIYADVNMPFPLNPLKKEYNIFIVKEKWTIRKGIIKELLCMDMAKRIWKKVDKLLNRNEDVFLGVFKDTHYRESTVIENLVKKCKNKAHIYMFEEGLSLYSMMKSNIKNDKAKRLIAKICGVSQYYLKGNPYGLHPYIEKVICQSPESLKNKYAHRDVLIEKQINIFDNNFSMKYVNAVLEDVPEKVKYDYVFLTMPIQEIGNKYKISNIEQKYEELLKKLLLMLSSKGKVFIKKHPRDGMDYSLYTDLNVEICSEEYNKMPFEVLYEYFNKPQMISLFSTVCTNISAEKTSLFLYKLIGIEDLGLEVDEEYLKEQNIKVCDDFKCVEKYIRA